MHRDELWQAFDRDGERLDESYSAAKGNPKEGAPVYVSACCTWLYRRTKNGIELLFQKRSKFVDRNPEKWDVSAGGHVNFGESFPAAAARELHEEIGAEVKPEDLEFIFTVLSVNGSNIYNHYFLYDWTGRVDDFHFNDQEVSEVKWVPLADFDAFVDQGAKDPIKKARHTREMTKTFLNLRGNHQP